ncbi:MAG: DUF1759 domain-containing protein, partial [Sphingobacteriales bacterium]
MVIDKNYGEIEKLQYLKTLVDGDAQTAIKNLAITGENFKKAWTILKERFDNRQAIMDNQLQAILDIEPVHTASAFRLKQ